MAFLLRVELPDVPGSLGALATALGAVGADIEAIEIIEHRSDGVAIDDVLLELPTDVMPDALVTACHRLDKVRVQWVSRYNAGAHLSMDLAAVEEFTAAAQKSLEKLIDMIPATFRADWAVGLCRTAAGIEVLRATPTAPKKLPGDLTGWFGVTKVCRLDPVESWDSTLLAAAPVSDDVVVVIGRHGGPAVLDSELARLGHLVALAAFVSSSS